MATQQRVSLEVSSFQTLIASVNILVDKNEALEKENALLKKKNEALEKEKGFLKNKIAFDENEKSVLKKEILKREKVENAMMEIARRKGRNGICDLMLPIHYREGEWGEDTEDGGLEEYTATSSDDE